MKKINLKTKSRFILLMCVLLLSGVYAVQAQNKNDEALKSLVRQMAAAQINYDAATLDKIYTSDFIEISPVGEFDLREKVIGFYKPNPRKTKPTVEADEFSIRSYDKFAVVIARLNFTQNVEGQPARPPMRMRVTLVCRKEKGDWKIASAQYTGIRPMPPQSSK